MLYSAKEGGYMYKILIVDDERIERNGIRFLLGRLDMELEISEAVNGLDAWERLEKEDFDILLTDVKMPFMDGIELIDRAAKAGKKLRCVIFSGCNEFDYAKQAIRLGVTNYILKPVDPEEFSATITKAFADIELAKADDEMKSRSREFASEHALYLLVNGTSIEKLEREYSGLTLDFVKYKRVMLMEFSHDFFGKRGDTFAENEKLKGLGVSRFLNLNQQQELLFFEEDDAAACGGRRTHRNPDSEYIKAANEIVRLVKSDYDDECYIAISSVVESPSDIPSKLCELELLMENKFYHPETHVFYQNMEGETPGIIQFDDDTAMKQMKQDIKMKEVEALREHFDRFCERYRGGNECSQIYIKFLFSNLLKDIYGSVDGVSVSELDRNIEKLYRASDITGLISIASDAMDRLEKCFAGGNAAEHREVEIVKQYIYRNYGSELGIVMLADMVYLAPSYLSTVFKKETGQNLSKFIKAYRMERARDMLENSMAKIGDIGVCCGYPNVSYFCSSFREFYGVSPQKFREGGRP